MAVKQKQQQQQESSEAVAGKKKSARNYKLHSLAKLTTRNLLQQSSSSSSRRQKVVEESWDYGERGELRRGSRSGSTVLQCALASLTFCRVPPSGNGRVERGGGGFGKLQCWPKNLMLFWFHLLAALLAQWRIFCF